MASSCIFLPLGLLVLSLLCAANADVRVWGLRSYRLTGDPFGNPPDPYVKVYCGSTFAGMTEFIKDNANPSWSADFSFRNGKAGDTLRLEVWDKDLNFDDHLGSCITTAAGMHREAAYRSPARLGPTSPSPAPRPNMPLQHHHYHLGGIYLLSVH